MIFLRTLFILSFVTLLESTKASYNILAVFPTPSISHQYPCISLTRALAEKGHNVTVLTSNPGLYDPLPNHHEIDLSITYKIFDDFMKKNNFSLQNKHSPFHCLTMFVNVLPTYIDISFQMEEVQKLLRSKETKFDLILYEGLHPSALGLVHHFNYPPSIAFFSVPRYVPVQFSVGNPINPSYVSSMVTENSDYMTFFERIKNTFYIFMEMYVNNFYMYPLCDAVIKRRFGQGVPPVKDLERNNSLLLLSGDLSQDYPIPMQPNTIQIGTLHVKNEIKPLQKNLKKWMDEAEDGVIYFSFGSNMKGTSVPEEKRNSFAKAFSQFPKFRVVWKWESDIEFPGKPSNVLLGKWLPQHSILAHPKVKLFITQGGHQSRQEAIHFGVPVLTVPFFWDQNWNAKKMEESGAGLSLNFYEITYEVVYEKLKALLTNPSFKRNIEKLSEISKDKPMNNSDTAVWWIEYVIRHKGAPHLRPALQNLSWYQYTLLDIAFFVLSVLVAILLSFYYIIKKCFCSSPNVNKKIKRH